MNDLDRVFAAASAVCQEATRRWFGDPHDSRFDVPLAMMLDLDDTLEGVGADLADSSTRMSRDDAERRRGLLVQPEGAS